MNTYSFCESVTGIGPWHIRQLSPAGKKTGGGIDSPSLCGRIYPSGATTPNGKRGFGGWDLDVEITEHHLRHACKECACVYRALIAIS
jgi:hypothetical protein